MNSRSQYNSLLAIASSNDRKQQICLEELEKTKTLREADNRIKESQNCEKERKERAQRIYECGLDKKKRNEENSLSNSLKMKNESQGIEKDSIKKRSRSISFKEFISQTSNMNPEILKMNLIAKINSKTNVNSPLSSTTNKKDESDSKFLVKSGANFLLKHETSSKPFQTHKQPVSFTKVPLVKKNDSLSNYKGSSSLSSKFSINKGKKNHFSTPIRSKNLTKSKIITEFHPNDLILLHTGPKRDSRTIEEIQNSIWRKKGKNFPFLYKDTSETNKNTPETNNSSKIPSNNCVSGNISSQNSFSDYKKAKLDSSEKNKTLDYNISSEIWKIFGKRKEDYISNNYDSDSDMETNAAQLQKEEEFSSRIGKIEDKEEERKEIERKIKKKRKFNIS
ncbi:hypothetical protein PNEG_04275 [Pneumocystis murina B123]|uniref:Uncharacterized protein n=1 Tax=Pneumocystis murina (strain B123) TaxID=1069680 RepID=A0A0W4ZX27_PNEMU|nr:hypothetical protein PNEG_04275 [Pneumocystis murina B123]KTW32922.1 hypothetical protein PNEG_04275 [Pneumocystis murina B123]